jgi:hypothetical protein
MVVALWGISHDSGHFPPVGPRQLGCDDIVTPSPYLQQILAVATLWLSHVSPFPLWLLSSCNTFARSFSNQIPSMKLLGTVSAFLTRPKLSERGGKKLYLATKEHKNNSSLAFD